MMGKMRWLRRTSSAFLRAFYGWRRGPPTANSSWGRWKVSSAWWVSSSVGTSKVGMKWSDQAGFQVRVPNLRLIRLLGQRNDADHAGASEIRADDHRGGDR
jgi:hypothetical protein